MDGDELIREISSKTGFTIKDSRIFYYAMIDVLADCVEKQIPINARGFIHLNYTAVKPRKGNRISTVIARKEDPNTVIEKVDYPETVRANVKLARNLKEIMKDGLKENEVEQNEIDE